MRSLLAIVLASGLLFAVVGCTEPTQKVAVRAEQLRTETTDSVVDTLSRKANQQILDNTARVVEAAVKAGDAVAAKAAVQKGFNDAQDIAWEKEQYLKAKTVAVFVKLRLYSEEGLFDIVARRWNEASQNVDSKNPATNPAK